MMKRQQDTGDFSPLIEPGGFDPSVGAHLDIVRQMCHKNAAIDLLLAKNQGEADKLWEIRRNPSPALYSIAPTKRKHDVVIPFNNAMSLINTSEPFPKKMNLPIAIFAGKGNLHENTTARQTACVSTLLTDPALESMKQIEQTFDPDGIFNPGNLFL